MTFNISYSAYDVWKRSPFQFYLQYVAKLPQPKSKDDYARAGSLVHDVIAQYLDNKSTDPEADFLRRWQGDSFLDFNGRPMDIKKYQRMLDYALDVCHRVVTENQRVEFKVEFEHRGMHVKSYLDLFVFVPGDWTAKVIDWKTDSKWTTDKHATQRRFYNWVLFKKYAITETECAWVYLGHQDQMIETLTESDAKAFERDIDSFIDQVAACGEDRSKYALGDWKHPFNAYIVECEAELLRRQTDVKELSFTIDIKGVTCHLSGDVDTLLLQGIDDALKFDLKDKHFMQKAAKERSRGVVDVREVGTVHLFDTKRRVFNLGHLRRVKKLIEQYCEYRACKLTLTINDHRRKNTDSLSFPKGRDVVLRHYQLTAIDTFNRANHHGIIQMATGAGKTFTAAKIIRDLGVKTLWIIDRKELMYQTKHELEQCLGCDIGVVGDSRAEPKDVTISTVQTLAQSETNTQWLSTIDFVVVDEFHKAAAESYLKVFRRLNQATKFLGLTATPTRDDGKTPILHSLLGDVIYSVTTEQLIKEGYLMKPQVRFYRTAGTDQPSEWADDYRVNVVENLVRNGRIIELINGEFKDKKVLVLTKLVSHGKELCAQVGDERIKSHLHGSVKDETRKSMMQGFRESRCGVLVTTIQIAAEGLDIPDLDVIVNASANKGDVKSVQVLGRVLRRIDGKTQAVYVDFADVGNHTERHSKLRMKALSAQGHTVQLI